MQMFLGAAACVLLYFIGAGHSSANSTKCYFQACFAELVLPLEWGFRPKELHASAHTNLLLYF